MLGINAISRLRGRKQRQAEAGQVVPFPNVSKLVELMKWHRRLFLAPSGQRRSKFDIGPALRNFLDMCFPTPARLGKGRTDEHSTHSAALSVFVRALLLIHPHEPARPPND